MSRESNQPVYKRSARLQSIIDLLEDEYSVVSDSSQIDELIDSSGLTREEMIIARNASLEMDVHRKKMVNGKSHHFTRITIGFFLFFGGLIFTLLTFSQGIIFFLSLSTTIAGIIYGIYHLKAYKESNIHPSQRKMRKIKK